MMIVIATLIVVGKIEWRWDDNMMIGDNTWRCSKSLIHTTQTVCSQSSPLVSLVYLNIRVRVEIIFGALWWLCSWCTIRWSRWFRIRSLCGGLWWSGWGSVGRFRKEVWTRRVALSLPISFPAFQQCATSTRSFAQWWHWSWCRLCLSSDFGMTHCKLSWPAFGSTQYSSIGSFLHENFGNCPDDCCLVCLGLT